MLAVELQLGVVNLQVALLELKLCQDLVQRQESCGLRSQEQWQ